MLERDLDLIAIFLLDLAQRRRDAIAEGALKIGELDDRHLRVLAALGRRIPNFDIVFLVGVRPVRSTRRASARRGRGEFKVSECLGGQLELIGRAIKGIGDEEAAAYDRKAH